MIGYGVNNSHGRRGSQTDFELSNSKRLSRIYHYENGRSGDFQKTLLVKTFDHMSSFAMGYDTRPRSDLLARDCPTFVLGRNDLLSQSFSDWDLPSVRGINGAPHDVVANHFSELRVIFQEFLACAELSK